MGVIRDGIGLTNRGCQERDWVCIYNVFRDDLYSLAAVLIVMTRIPVSY